MHIGLKILEGTSEVGLYQTQGTLDAFTSLQMKRQQWPLLVTQQLMLVLWLLSSLHANIPYLTGS